MALQSCPFLSTDCRGSSGCPSHPSHLPHFSKGNSFSPCQTASCPASSTPLVLASSALKDFSALHQKPSLSCCTTLWSPAEHRVAVLTGPRFPNTKETTKLNQHPGFSYSLKTQQALLSSAVQFRPSWSFTPSHALWQAAPALHLSLATTELIAAAGCGTGLCTKHQSSAVHSTEGR